MERRRLIINADDFGQSRGINKGIILSHEKGIVTSTSLMVRYPSAIEAAEYTKSNTTLGVGLHLDLGEWVFKDGNWEMSYSVVNLENTDAIKSEVEEQVNRFLQLMGRKPTHIDSHQHAHLSASVVPIVEEIARTLNITLRSRSTKVHYCGNFYGQATTGEPHHDIISVDGLRTILSVLPADAEIIELGCHPALDNDIKTMYKLERELEVETLCNHSLQAELAERGFKLSSFEGVTF